VNSECRDCGRHMLLFARHLCAACYKLRRNRGTGWDGPPPSANRRIHRAAPLGGPGVCPDCRRWCERRGGRGFCANCYRIRKNAGGDWDGPPPDVARPTQWPAPGHWTVKGRPARPAPAPSSEVDWRAMSDVVRVLR